MSTTLVVVDDGSLIYIAHKPSLKPESHYAEKSRTQTMQYVVQQVPKKE